jgi:hypothetical protein
VEASLAGKLGLAPSFQVALDTASGTTRVPGGRVAEVTPRNATAANQEFLFTTMEAVQALSPDIQGVLNQEFLSRFDYLLDFRGRRLVFSATAPDGRRIPARVIDGRMAIQTSCGDLVLDSGTQALVLFLYARVLGSRRDHSDGVRRGCGVDGARRHGADRGQVLSPRYGRGCRQSRRAGGRASPSELVWLDLCQQFGTLCHRGTAARKGRAIDDLLDLHSRGTGRPVTSTAQPTALRRRRKGLKQFT